MRSLSFLYYLCTISYLQVASSAQSPLVSTTIDLGYVEYQGTKLANGINQYVGMRYAAPPVGDNRWRAPAGVPPEFGIQSATKVSRQYLL
jgi:hypothetical protein